MRHIFLDGVRYAESALLGAILICDSYPARDARMDYNFGAKRIEWNYKNMNNFPWMAVTDVSIPAITYKYPLTPVSQSANTIIRGLDASPPELKGYARAGANVTVQWSGIIRMHLASINERCLYIYSNLILGTGYHREKL